MKKLLYSLVIAFISISSFSQNYSGYEYVVVPDRFDFLSEKNQYNLNELTKFLIDKKGIPAYFDTDDKPIEFHIDPCRILMLRLTKEKSFLSTKLKLTLTDCRGNIIAESIGESQEKSYRVAYNYALRGAFDVLYIPSKEITDKRLELRNEKESELDPSLPKDSSFLYAQKTTQGYKLLDSEDNEKYILFKTSKNDQFIISNQEKGINGALYKARNPNEWILEYLKDDQVITEILKIRF